MNIGLYHPYRSTLGGGQRYLGVAAEVLARAHRVELVHHCPDFDPAAVGEALELDLGRVGLRYLPRQQRPDCPPGNAAQRFRWERDWGREISAGYDLFINSSEAVPLFCHAARGVLINHFPLVTFEEFHAHTGEAWRQRSWWRRLAGELYHRFEWNRRFGTYNLCVTNSNYSRAWLRRRWGMDSAVVYPPVRTGLRLLAKEPLILSVGAFHHEQHKKHEVTLKAFRDLCDAGLSGWRYVMAGACGQDEQDRSYLAGLRARAEGYPIEVRTNVRGGELKGLLGSSSVLWHSMGYGVDAAKEPGLMEHFGMVATEAMAAGCVPVVFNGGGLPESVIHGETGLLWRTLDQLNEHTLALVRDDRLRDRLARGAAARAELFSPRCFEERLLQVLGRALC
jgi:glycosyltransferase involved in cell wall biosynthesis